MQFVILARRILSATLIWTLSFGLSFGQLSNIDSLKQVLKGAKEDTFKVQTLNHLSYALFSKKPDSTILLGQQAYQLSIKLKYPIGETKALNRVGIGFYMNGQYDSAYQYYLRSKEIAVKLGELETVANLDTNLGIIHWYQGEYDDAARMMNESLKYYESVGREKQQAKILANIGGIYLGINQYAEAIDYFKRAIKIQRKIEGPRALAVSYNNLGICYTNLGKYDKALESFLDSEKAIQGTGDNFIAAVYNGIGSVMSHRGEYDKALEYRLKALDIYTKEENKFEVATTLANLGIVYSNLDDLEKASQTYNEALDILNSFDKICSWSVLSDLSKLKMKQRQYDSAIYYAKVGIQKGLQCTDERLIASCNSRIARAYLFQDQVSNAKPYALESYKIAKKIKTKSIQKDASELLSIIHEREKRYDKALAFYKESMQLKDSLLDVEKASEIAKMQAEYEFNKEKEAIEIEAEKAAIAFEADQRRSSLMLYFSIAVVILFVGLFISAYISYRRKRSDNVLIAEQNKELEELSGFKEGLTHMIAHDMKNSLNTILGLSASEPYDKKMHTISQSGNVMLNLVTNMLDVQKFEEAQVHVNLKSHKLSEIIEEARIQVAILFQMKSLSLEIDVQRNLELNVDGELLTRVFVNLLTNAVKYSPTGRTVSIRTEVSSNHSNDPKCNIYIKDQGEGISKDDLPHVFDKFWQAKARKSGDAMSTGLGLTFCKLAVSAHEGSITVNSEKGEGSEFKISLPLESDKIWTEELSDKTLYDASVVSISVQEKAFIEPFIKELKQLEVYQVGELNQVLDKMNDLAGSKWKNDLELAIQQADDQMYKELLNIIE